MNLNRVSIIHFVRKLKSRHGLRKIAVNTGWLFFDRILRLGVGLFVGVWVARYLGPDQFGIWSYASAFVLLFSPFAVLGLDSIVVREIVKDPTRKEEILGSAFALKLAGGFLTFILSIVIIGFIRPENILMRSIVAITATGLIFQSFDTIDFYFQSQVQSKYTTWVKGAAFLIISFLKVVLILRKTSLMSFVLVVMAETILAGGGLVFAYRFVKQNIFRWKMHLSVARDLLNDSWPLILAGLVVAIYMRIDQIMLGNMIGNAAVGKYSAAVRISELWYVIPTAISISVFPAVVNMRKTNEALYLSRLQKFYDLMVWLGIAIAIPMTFCADNIVRFLYGTQFQGAGTVLAIHIWTGPFVFFGVASSQYLIAENQTKISFYRTAAGAVINVILNLMLITRYHGTGAAFATLVAQIFVACISPAFFKESKVISLMFAKSLNLYRITRNLRRSYG
ncbi:MAG: flippase [Candidatus Omnitrophica bacterium]|nr:flippase [Candidatus Omnitrophota bacterium]